MLVPLDFNHTPSATCSRSTFPLKGALPLLYTHYWHSESSKPDIQCEIIEEGSASLVMRTWILVTNDPPEHAQWEVARGPQECKNNTGWVFLVKALRTTPSHLPNKVCFFHTSFEEISSCGPGGPWIFSIFQVNLKFWIQNMLLWLNVQAGLKTISWFR